MRLQKLHIRNFRKIEDLTIHFPKGLCVIVGENNAGKTAIIDALRLMLLPSRDFDTLRVGADDFRYGSNFTDIEISCTFSDLESRDEVFFLECLVDIGDGKFEIQLHARISFNQDTGRANVKMWGGETESGSIPTNFYDRIASVYLQPLRDPEKGLRPGQNSQISRLISCLTEENQRGDFETIVREANDGIKQLRSVVDAQNEINTQVTDITGQELTQQTKLIFSDPSFRRIIAGLQPEIEELPCELNGLGYNNLVFTAATLGTLRSNSQFLFRSILVEEPEAHLHPHLQVLLLQHFERVAKPEADNYVQVIASSHSPILVSQAPIDSIVSVHECNNQVSAVSICSIDIDPKIKKKLQRFLDATRAELFFARRLLMVEGIAEALLLPVLTKIAGGSLKKSSVTLLNADGINFNAFLPLFGDSSLQFPVAILTDGDAKEIGANPSNVATSLKEKTSKINNLSVEYSEITFEHELARSSDLLPFMLDAFENLHPHLGRILKADINAQGYCILLVLLILLANEESENQVIKGVLNWVLTSLMRMKQPCINAKNTDDEKANLFLDRFLEKEVSKGEFAQELAILLNEANNLTIDSIPQYIQNTLRFLRVI